MAERIRLRVWLLGLGPVVVIAGVLVALFAGFGKKPAPRAVVASDPAPTVQAAAVTGSAPSVQPTPVQAPAAAAAPPPSVPPIIAAAASSLILAGPPPEPIPELDALARPKGSEQWTPEQKLAYREQAFQALDAKERSLEQEIAVAKRRGDTDAAQEKQATLDYLRARRAQIDEMLKRHDPLRDAVQDAGN
jgi:hypothetical protein